MGALQSYVTSLNQRPNQLADQERDARSQLLFNEYQKGGVTPGQVRKGIDDLYAHEPEETRLGRFGHFMAKAIKGKQQQSPQVTNSTVPGQAGATLPNMDGSPGSVQQTTGPAPKMTHKQDFDSIIDSTKNPEQLAAADAARQVSQEGAKTQAYTGKLRAQSDEERRQAIQSVKEFPAAYKQATGQEPSPEVLQAFTLSALGGDKALTAVTQGEALKSRKESQNATLELRKRSIDLQQAKADLANNPNSIAARTKMMQAQAAVTRASAYAKSVEGRYQGTINGQPLPGDIIDEEGGIVAPINAPNVRPTGQARGRAALADSALEQIGDMKSILQTQKEMFGPGYGQKTAVTKWLGTQDPEAQRFEAAATTTADHLMAVYGGRSTAAGQQLEHAMAQLKTNPEATIAALDQFAKAASTVRASGSYRTVGGGSGGPNGRGPAPQKGKQAMPSGATHIVPGPDGKNHYTNDKGTVDLGLAP